jgi:hypothetical protein
LYPKAPNYLINVKEVVIKLEENSQLYDRLKAFLSIPFDREKAEREFNASYQIRYN